MLRYLIGLLALAVFPVTAPAQSIERVTLRLDYLNSGYHAIWYFAMDRGLFKNDGIDLEVLEGRGSATTAQTVGNGSVMFGTADTGAVMGLISQGLPVKIVGGYLRQSPFALIFPKKNNWSSYADLAHGNPRIGVSPGSGAAVLLPAVLKAANLEGKVQIITMDPAAKPTSLLDGKVDAIESFDFLQIPLLEASGMPSASLPFSSAGINVPGLSLIASNDLIGKNPALVRKMVGLMQKTIELGRANPDAAIDSLLTRAPTLKRDIVTRVLKLSFNLIDSEAAKGHPIGWMSPEIMARSQDILLQYGQIKTKQPIETYFTNAFVPGGWGGLR
jgi:NitT/TauT family transport system substrate-binding protein